jgi:hypothetical protein
MRNNKTRLRFLVLVFFFGLSFYCETFSKEPADPPTWYNRIFLKGDYTLSDAFVKSTGFPVGSQVVSSYDGAIGYNFHRLSASLFFGGHYSIYSLENSFVLYRDYHGLESGIDVRYGFQKKNSILKKYGAGVLLYGSYDQYDLVRQYMVYPSCGVLLFSSFDLFRMYSFMPLEIAVPFIYSFRQSGPFLSIGLSAQGELKIP